ncbi:TIGR04283 family arsenosugar biosynthesis glycosyltransferase [Agrilactobacillus yilanensis]|uniref:4,4'-diaponeurosporenoate glycosyltransferase n=1 Tax=Agrilactobacillus yilanensis TaxID=2485997 RepID=A0ABW4J9R4_9LACO|nr:TIGR04283 family arsenosugar biosynthesis glycosyltransferase [Agrilactobacillus yilanensis]
MWLTIIIPVYQDDAALQRLLAELGQWDLTDVAVIIVDGSQRARPAFLPEDYQYVTSPKANRGAQLQLGARLAQSKAFLFLHADSRFPEGSPLPTLRQTTAKIGFFTLKFDDHRRFFKNLARSSNFRARRAKLLFGDQGLFIQRAIYEQSGGFKAQPLMEDWALSRQLARLNVPFTQFALPILTSARKYQTQGPWRTFWHMQSIKLQYIFGVAPEKLQRRYYRKR